MIVLNLTGGVKMYTLPNNQDVIIRPRQLSNDFACNERILRAIVSQPDYQNQVRIVLTPSERDLISIVPIYPKVLIPLDEAKEWVKKMADGIFPAKLDIKGEVIEPEVKEPEKKEDPDTAGDPDSDHKEETKQKESPDFSFDLGELTVKLNPGSKEKNGRVHVTNPHNVKLEWGTSDAEVATVDDDGKLHLKKKGNCQIIARSVETEEFYQMELSYNLIVK